MTEECTGLQLDKFMDGYTTARTDWKQGQLYASYLPTRDPDWKDGYALYARSWKGVEPPKRH